MDASFRQRSDSLIFQTNGTWDSLEQVVPAIQQGVFEDKYERCKHLASFNYALTRAMSDVIVYGNESDREKGIFITITREPKSIAIRFAYEGDGLLPSGNSVEASLDDYEMKGDTPGKSLFVSYRLQA